MTTIWRRILAFRRRNALCALFLLNLLTAALSLLIPEQPLGFCLDRRKILSTSCSGILGNLILSVPDAMADTKSLDIISAAQLESFEGRLLVYPDAALRINAGPVREFGPDLEIVVETLIDAMAGNATTPVQYGIDARIIILKGESSPNDDGDVLVLVNPNVLARSTEDKMMVWTEYCSTIEEGLLKVDVLRDAIVEIAAQDYKTGRPIRKALSGESARAFQHELDHLNGILLPDHADLQELPDWIIRLERAHHRLRQQRAFSRTVYSGNGPLYW